MSIAIQGLQIEHGGSGVFTDERFPRLSYYLESDEEGTVQTAYQVRAGEWDSGKICSEQSPAVELCGAWKPFEIYSVSLTVWDNHGNEATAETRFCTGKLDEPWTGKWITDQSIKTDKKRSPEPLSVFRTFSASRKVRRALICATAVGNYFLTVNGRKITSDMLAPGYTSYAHMLQYQIYDATGCLTDSQNSVEAVVSGGWAVGYFGFFGKARAFAPRQLFRCELRLEYADGSVETIPTDEHWLVSIHGAYSIAGLYEGVTFDARKTTDNTPWKPADVAQWREHPEIRCTYGVLPHRQEIMRPVEQHPSRRGGTIYDLGQNCSAVVCMKIKTAKAGQVITVKHAEVLVEDELFTANLRKAAATITYICKDGPQEFSPELTTMGFRYIRVQGIRPENIDVSVQVVSSLDASLGGFHCSDERLNQLQRNIQWGARSNFVDIPTDCPQRDERMGWTGDIAVFSSAACFNYDASRFFDKWLLDLNHDQGHGGGIPFVIPAGKLPIPTFATAGWSDCAAIVPWVEYLKNGDIRLIKRQYRSIVKLLKAEQFWARFLSFGKNRYIWKGLFQFGDWLSPGEGLKEWTHKGKWIATAYFYHTAHIAFQIAERLGENADAQRYHALMKKIEDAYRDIFTDGHGKLREEFQSGYICPVHFGMLTETERREMGNHLAELVKKNQYRIDTGFLGTPYLLFALSDTGHTDEAYRVLQNEECPGWLYAVRMGATTIWERWDAILPDGSVNLSNEQSGGKAASSKDFDSEDQTAPSMTSFNHYAYGAVGDWLYRRIAGLEPLEPGWRTFIVKPYVGGNLHYAEAYTKTPYGVVRAKWERSGEKLTMLVDVPVGTVCHAFLPDGSHYELRSGRHSVSCTASYFEDVSRTV